ncbi:MAG: bifunctional adenosylcobinamide kinase/adenosylcobinamide-phosphate guanylyltransferase [Clostridium sp.]|nr:bifunctional adenosylcobinamide kinase/adenosylcobinamide-phosphate guanylyltransferase [Acetatifactor muris]MCM1527229.1 bifunctional adenosylcobinamide kinase/adenosylcobinamide-phosphate guanylyltransferase [Bacteroides sp.]MCM1563076.1 bifunctional adenosylcobinamide kinase/adenosylcobinamide-phosphate guanylyltransferase [Clostridium sp.]
MMILIVGGSGSGKSSYAERIACELGADDSGGIPKYYLATMRIWDEEGQRKADRHQQMREGKGFLTVEQATDISDALHRMTAGEKVILLECVSNLTANEMFAEGEMRARSRVEERVLRDIGCLRNMSTHLVVVSNNVFEDGTVYDPSTMEYIRAMGRINTGLAALADRVVEVVAGIPVRVK